MPFHRFLRAAIVVMMLVAGARADADDGLTTINNPGGGQIVYGSLTKLTSLKDAMGFVLRTVHSHFGDRPQLGKFFRARDSHSIATFFTVNEKRGGGVNVVTGLVVISMPDGSAPAAAVLYDDTTRFGKTGPAMIKKLGEVWRAAETANAAAAPHDPASPPALTMATGGDRSAGIALAEGWRLTGVGHGRLSAEGPNGEMIDLGRLFHQIHDQGIPRTGKLFDAFVSVSNEDRHRARLPDATYKLIEVHDVPHSKMEGHAIHAAFEVDFHDGKGVRTGSARIAGIYPKGPAWEMSVDTSNMPKSVADAETPMMVAILNSFTQDGNVIAKEAEDNLKKTQRAGADHDAKMAAHMKAIDDHARKFDAHMKAMDDHARAFNAHMDNMDRYSKSFQNNTFDRSQVQDNDRHERATVGNADADALVKADPNRFQIVPTEDFIKGVDY